MLGLSKRKIIVLAVVLMALAVASHIFFRLSPAYSSAVATYEKQHASIAPADISLCFSCKKRISYGNGIWHYRFTLIVVSDGSTQKVRVHSQSLPRNGGYAVAFE
jgi:hypothetical protein